MKIAREDIAAVYVNNGPEQVLICTDCCLDKVFEEAWEKASRDDIVTQDDIEASDNLFFCDQCNKRI